MLNRPPNYRGSLMCLDCDKSKYKEYFDSTEKLYCHEYEQFISPSGICDSHTSLVQFTKEELEHIYGDIEYLDNTIRDLGHGFTAKKDEMTLSIQDKLRKMLKEKS